MDLLAGSEASGQSCYSFITTAANILGLSAILLNRFLFCFFFCACVRALFRSCSLNEACARRKRYMFVRFSAAVSKKSQQRLTFGCQLKEDTNYRHSARILKAEMFYVALCPLRAGVGRRLRLPFPDSSQRGVCRVVIVMPQLLCRSGQPRIITS